MDLIRLIRSPPWRVYSLVAERLENSSELR